MYARSVREILCGDRGASRTFEMESNSVEIMFATDSSVAFRGWRMTWTGTPYFISRYLLHCAAPGKHSSNSLIWCLSWTSLQQWHSKRHFLLEFQAFSPTFFVSMWTDPVFSLSPSLPQYQREITLEPVVTPILVLGHPIYQTVAWGSPSHFRLPPILADLLRENTVVTPDTKLCHLK